MSDKNKFDELSCLKKEIRSLRKSLDILTSPIDIILKRRGFQIYKKNPSHDLLIPAPEFIDDYYKMLHKYSFRLFLRDVIKNQDFIAIESVSRYAAPDVTKRYLEYIAAIELAVVSGAGHLLAKKPVKGFGETLEWYVAEVFKREFYADAIWGVKFKRPNIGGDYDIITKFNGAIFYVEVKSSPPKQICANEVYSFLDRVFDLSPEMAIFLMDTELRMKDKIVPMFENELKKRYEEPPDIIRMEKELFQIWNKIFIINAKDSIVDNIGKVLTRYSRR